MKDLCSDFVAGKDKTPRKSDKFDTKDWVAVDDLIKWINQCDDGTAFNEYQIRKRTILNALSNENKKEEKQ